MFYINVLSPYKAKNSNLAPDLGPVLTLTDVQLVLAFSRIRYCILSLMTFCLHNKMYKLILERGAQNCMLPVVGILVDDPIIVILT